MYSRGETPLSTSTVSGGIDLLPALTVSALSVLTWDIIAEFARDLKLLRSVRGRGLRGAPYVIARLATFAFVISSTIFQVTPLGPKSCTQAHKTLTTLYSLSISATYLLVFFRVRTAFYWDGYISLLFGVLWLFLCGAVGSMVYGSSFQSSSTPSQNMSINGYRQGTSCLGLGREDVKPYVFIALLGPLVYISLVYMFQSARFVTHGAGFKPKLGHLEMDSDMELWGDGLLPQMKIDGVQSMRNIVSVLAKGLLGDGQGYYLLTILIQLVSFILFLSSASTSEPQTLPPDTLGPQSSIGTRFVLLVPTMVITNVMVCKVYRNTLALESDSRRGQNIQTRKPWERRQFVIKEMDLEIDDQIQLKEEVRRWPDPSSSSETWTSGSLDHGTTGYSGTGDANGTVDRVGYDAQMTGSSSSVGVGGIWVTKTIERF